MLTVSCLLCLGSAPSNDLLALDEPFLSTSLAVGVRKHTGWFYANSGYFVPRCKADYPGAVSGVRLSIDVTDARSGARYVIVFDDTGYVICHSIDTGNSTMHVFYETREEMRRAVTGSTWNVVNFRSARSTRSCIMPDGYVNPDFVSYASIVDVPDFDERDEIVSADNQTTCAVCLNSMRPGLRNVHMLDCGHIFHTACVPPISFDRRMVILHADGIVWWVACPLCRRETAQITDAADVTNMLCSILDKNDDTSVHLAQLLEELLLGNL